MKKKIIFMIINMNVGGTERALLNMISEMPEDQYDITLLMLEKYGGFLDQIPGRVEVKYVSNYQEMKEILTNTPKKTIVNTFKKMRWIKALNLVFVHLISKIMKDRSYLFNYLLKNTPALSKKYDIAVAYAGPMDFISYFVVNKIKAKKRIQWIHFDVTKIGFNINFASKIYRYYEKVYVVSEEARKKINYSMPSIEKKTEVFLNIVSPRIIRDQAKSGIGFDDNFDGLRILTVGRLSAEKGQDLAIKALKRLITEEYNVKWYCIGEGDARVGFEELIKENKLQKEFMLLGANSNPYPYIKQCDIYVQPSRYEGYCITLIEARVLKRPIVTTNCSGAKEQIINNKTGFIVNIDEKEIYEAVKILINSSRQRDLFSSNLSNETFEVMQII